MAFLNAVSLAVEGMKGSVADFHVYSVMKQL